MLDQYDEMKFAGARLLGKDISKILDGNDNLKALVIKILVSLLNDFDSSDIDQMYSGDRFDKKLQNLKLIKELLIELR